MIRTLALLGLLPLAAGQDARRWAEALAAHQKYAASKDPVERARAATELGNATAEKYDRVCWQLLANLLRQEFAREGVQGKTEERVAGEVVEAAIRALQRISHKDVVAEMTRVARSRQEPLRLRLAVIWGLAERGALKDLMELADDKVPQIQVAAMDVLAQRAADESVPLFLRVLGENRTWEVKLLALQGLEKIAPESAVEPLLEGLGRCRADEGRLKDQYVRTLRKITGLELENDDPNAWKAAWAAKKAGQEAPAGSTVAEATEFYGLKTRSTRIVFILDRSGSMLAPGSEPAQRIFKLPPDAMGGPKEPPQETAAREEATRIKKRVDAVPVATRWDALRQEFVNTIYVLSPRVHFNVIWYEARTDPWRQELVPATWVNKLECIRHAEKLVPSGGTNIWDALELAFQTIETPQRPDLLQIDRRVNYATAISGPDTFFLMTDGAPTFGRILTPEGILSELRKVNRLRKVTIHTICVGDLVPGAQPGENPDPAFLKRIANETGGDFVHIRK
jgi:hypothetical protein